MGLRTRSIPEWLWSTGAAGLLSALIGAAGVWVGLPWFFPSLGPTIFLQVYQSD